MRKTVAWLPKKRYKVNQQKILHMRDQDLLNIFQHFYFEKYLTLRSEFVDFATVVYSISKKQQ